MTGRQAGRRADQGGGNHTCGVTLVSVTLRWGDNCFGRLGDGNAPTGCDLPVAIVLP